MPLGYLHRHPEEVIVSRLRLPVMSGSVAQSTHIVRALIGESEDNRAIHQTVAKGLGHNHLMRPWNYSSLRTLLKGSLVRKRDFREQHLRAIFSLTHDDVGAALFPFWNLHAELLGAVAHHHCAGGDGPLPPMLHSGGILEIGNASSAHDPDRDSLIVQWAEEPARGDSKGRPALSAQILLAEPAGRVASWRPLAAAEAVQKLPFGF